jgi:anti-anti-sigma factor
MSTPSRLTVGRTSTGYLIALEGRGTLFQSPSFQDLVDHCLREESTTLVVDLTDCEYLDSTFLGCLVTLHRRYNKSGQIRLEVHAPGGVRDALLRSSHLNRFFAFATSTPEVLGEAASVDMSRPDRDVLGRHVEEAHRRLAELGGDDAAAFGRIAQSVAGG